MHSIWKLIIIFFRLFSFIRLYNIRVHGHDCQLRTLITYYLLLSIEGDQNFFIIFFYPNKKCLPIDFG